MLNGNIRDSEKCLAEVRLIYFTNLKAKSVSEVIEDIVISSFVACEDFAKTIYYLFHRYLEV